MEGAIALRAQVEKVETEPETDCNRLGADIAIGSRHTRPEHGTTHNHRTPVFVRKLYYIGVYEKNSTIQIK